MARLTAPNGSTVNVSDERAKRLLEQGYTTAKQPTVTSSTARKSSSSKSEK